MKKILAIFVLVSFITSCGPKRLGCGPGRCDIETPKTTTLLKNIC
ncbi:hypothetical protein C8C84_0360 [Flavobacterium sp. 102]|nr:hypothetical protein C8C84_0360 [Flavobacterium sp. 102]